MCFLEHHYSSSDPDSTATKTCNIFTYKHTYFKKLSPVKDILTAARARAHTRTKWCHADINDNFWTEQQRIKQLYKFQQKLFEIFVFN